MPSGCCSCRHFRMQLIDSGGRGEVQFRVKLCLEGDAWLKEKGNYSLEALQHEMRSPDHLNKALSIPVKQCASSFVSLLFNWIFVTPVSKFGYTGHFTEHSIRQVWFVVESFLIRFLIRTLTLCVQ